MKTPFLHLVRRLAHDTPASWFPACLEEATGFAPRRLADGLTAECFTPRAERLRGQNLVHAGTLLNAYGHAPHGALVILPVNGGRAGDGRGVDTVYGLRQLLVAESRALFDAALADERLVAHLDVGAPAGSLAALAALQFLRDRYAVAAGRFFLGQWRDGLAAYDQASLTVDLAGVPAPLALWLAAGIAARTGCSRALVHGEEDGSAFVVERPTLSG